MRISTLCTGPLAGVIQLRLSNSNGIFRLSQYQKIQPAFNMDTTTISVPFLKNKCLTICAFSHNIRHLFQPNKGSNLTRPAKPQHTDAFGATHRCLRAYSGKEKTTLFCLKQQTTIHSQRVCHPLMSALFRQTPFFNLFDW